jgi:hypothetical protein
VKLNLKKIVIYPFVAACPMYAFSQKVRVGYDKAADFVKFKTYTWTAPTMPITRPLLYASIVGTIDHELKAKGLTRTERDGDLALTPAGGMEFGLNVAMGTPILSTYGGAPPTIDANMWTGASGFSNLMAPYVPEGTLALTFVDRSSNKVIWTGTVTEKLDIENKKKSLERVDKAIAKLLKQFPPKRKERLHR